MRPGRNWRITGLMSRTGVPSTASSPRTRSSRPRAEMISQMVQPIRLGRRGRDVADASGPDLAGAGCRLLVGFGGGVQIGEEVRRPGEQPRAEPGLERLDDGVAAVKALAPGPGIQVGVPGLSRYEP